MSTASELKRKRDTLLSTSPRRETPRRVAAATAPTPPPPPKGGEVGNTGTSIAFGVSGGGYRLIEEDYNPELRGVAFFKEIERMRRSDSQVKAVMSMVKLPLRAATWGFERTSDDPVQREIEDWLNVRFFNDQMRPWDYTLRHMLLSLDFGTMPFELVFDILDDDILSRPMVRLTKMAPRMPHTIYEWNVTEDGQLAAIIQETGDPSKPRVTIDGERILPFVHEMEGANYRGNSLLRNARKDWVIKERLQRINQVAIEKRASGIDVGEMDETAITDASNKGAFEGVLQSVRTHERGFILLPPGHKYSIAGIEGQVLDPLPSIKYADVMILRGVLADFLTAGSGGEGSFSLVRDRSSFFLMALRAIANELREPINRYLVPRLVRWNWPDVNEFPQLVHSRLDRRDVQVMTSALKDLIPMGVITPDSHLEDEVREWLDLPAADTDDLEPLPYPGEDEQDDNDQLEAFKRNKARRRRPYEVNAIRKFKPRTAAERAVDWIALSSAIDTTQKQIADAYKALQKRQVDKLVDEGMKAINKRDVEMLLNVNVPFKTEAADIILKHLKSLYSLGQNEVKHEMARMGGEILRLAAPLAVEEDQVVLNFLRARAKMVSSVLADRIRTTFLRQALDMVRDGETDPLLLRGAITELSDRAIISEAGQVVSEALNLGRDSTAKKNELLVKGVEFSAIMDDATCDPCSSLDNKEFVYGSDAFERARPPYSDCDGRGRCRCVFIYTFASEAPGRA